MNTSVSVCVYVCAHTCETCTYWVLFLHSQTATWLSVFLRPPPLCLLVPPILYLLDTLLGVSLSSLRFIYLHLPSFQVPLRVVKKFLLQQTLRWTLQQTTPDCHRLDPHCSALKADVGSATNSSWHSNKLQQTTIDYIIFEQSAFIYSSARLAISKGGRGRGGCDSGNIGRWCVAPCR